MFTSPKVALSRNLTIALIYVLHVLMWSDLDTNDLPLNEDTRKFVEAYGNWVPCICSPECDRRWNYADCHGIRRQPPHSTFNKCFMEQWHERPKSNKGLEMDMTLRSQWLESGEMDAKV